MTFPSSKRQASQGRRSLDRVLALLLPCKRREHSNHAHLTREARPEHALYHLPEMTRRGESASPRRQLYGRFSDERTPRSELIGRALLLSSLGSRDDEKAGMFDMARPGERAKSAFLSVLDSTRLFQASQVSDGRPMLRAGFRGCAAACVASRLTRQRRATARRPLMVRTRVPVSTAWAG